MISLCSPAPFQACELRNTAFDTHTHALWSSLMAYINSNLYDVLLQLFFIFRENKWHIFVILLTKFLINFILVVSFVKAYLWICLLINSTH